eukprot:14869561-Alexandrium_andersonii.AAC.1
MSASLVGSEMCIRDSPLVDSPLASPIQDIARQGPWRVPRSQWRRTASAVSYTHLTLPTICSV